MKNISKGLIIAFSLVPCWAFSQKTVSIDVKRDVHSISPYIYGTNESYDGATATRWGGNRSTSYNWENNASNGGNDYNFTSDNYYDNTGKTTPAYPILNATKQADSKKQYNIVSLQAAGYVAADKNGVVTEEQIAPSNRWKAISFHKDTEKYPYTLEPDLTDDTVYIDELINYLSVKLGRAGDGGVSAYAIDNEPYLWNQTHARLHPQQTSADELIEKTVNLSNVIRKLAPGADIYGPMFFGYTDAYHWGPLNKTPEWTAIYEKSNGYPVRYSWFVDYYLDTLRKIEEETGHKAIDAIAFHWYPESYGATTKKRIVDLDNSSSASELIATDMIEARLQAPRALWDSKYNYLDQNGNRSYVCMYFGQAIIKKIKKSIDNFYPGTKIAFTEFEYDAEDHWSGGLCLVDVLGVFAREDVYLACKWDTFKKYSIAAYNLYLNYDGNGSQYGKTSVYAMQSDTVSLSSYASVDENKNLHIVVVNKTNSEQNTTFNIENGLYSDGVVYGFGQTSSNISQLGTIDNIENSSFSYTVPAYSAIHIILNVIPQTEIVKAQIVEPNADEIVVSFKDELSLLSANEAKDEFTVKVNDTEYDINTVSVSGKTAIIKLANAILATDKNISVSYNGENVIGASDLPVEIFDTIYVYNELDNAPIYLLGTEISEIGTNVKLSFSKELQTVNNNAGISIEQNEQVIALDSVKISKENPYELYLYPSERIVRYHPTILSSTNSTDLLAVDGSGLADFTVQLTGGANYAPKIDSAILFDNYTILVYFNANMNPETDYDNVGFTIANDGNIISYTTSYNKYNCILTFKTKEALEVGRKYTLSYKDDGKVVTTHNGVLDSFNMPLENKLEDSGAEVVTIPGVVQGEQYWTRIGNPVVEECSDTSSLGSGKHLGYISIGDSYTYKINIPEDKNYTVYLRYASADDGELNFIIDDKKYHLTIPSSSSYNKWNEVYRVIPLSAGEHDLTINVVNNGFNINYFRFEDEEKYPNLKINKAIIPAKGQIMNLYFNTNIEILPLSDEISVTCNDTIEIPFSKIEFDTESVLNFYFDTTIYKKDVIRLNISSPTIFSTDGGHLKDTSIIISNKSTQTYVPPTPNAISKINEDNIVVSPVPAFVKQEFVIASSNSEKTISFSIISSNGTIVESGTFTGSTTITINQAGTYSIKTFDGEQITFKKIIVR